jgi:hypothetical protein
LKLDAASLSLIGTGNLRDADTDVVVQGIISDPERRDVVIQTSRAWRGEGSPTPGLAIARALPPTTAGPALTIVATVPPPPGTDQVIGAIVAPGGNRMLVATWDGPGEQSTRTLAVTADGNFRNSRTVENFVVGPGSCTSSDGSRVFSPSAPAMLEIRTLDTRALVSASVRPPSVEGGVLSPVAFASGGSCRVLIVGRASQTSPDTLQVPASIYDLERQGLVRRLTFPTRGEYSVSPDGSLVVVDERIVVPNLLQSGRAIGRKYKKTGVLRVFDAESGAEGSARLPEGGWLAGIDGSTGYYVSPGLLSVVDLKTGKIATTVKHPFVTAFVAFLAEP